VVPNSKIEFANAVMSAVKAMQEKTMNRGERRVQETWKLKYSTGVETVGKKW
jgi:hypothetical protein